MNNNKEKKAISIAKDGNKSADAFNGKEYLLKKKKEEEGSVGQLSETTKKRVIKDLCSATKGSEIDVTIVFPIF
jgi:hypothetical protein